MLEDQLLGEPISKNVMVNKTGHFCQKLVHSLVRKMEVDANPHTPGWSISERCW